jgi:amidase
MVIPTDYASTWASSAGLPEISIPLSVYPDQTPVQKGLLELIAVAPGIPFGLTFLSKKWFEEMLIGIAAAFEKATNYREPYVLGPDATMPTIEIADVLANKTSPTVNATSTGPTFTGT